MGGKSDWRAKEWKSGRKTMEVGEKNNGAMELGRGKKEKKRAARTGRKVEKWRTGREIM